MQAGDIDLFGAAFLELFRQVALRVRRQAEYHHPGRVQIQPMHQQHGRKGAAQPFDQAIRPVLAPAGHRQKPRGLVHDQHLVIGMDHLRLRLGRLIDKAHFQTIRSANPANSTEATRFITRIRAARALPASPAAMP